MTLHATTPGTTDARRVVVGASLAFAAMLVIGGWLLLWVRGQSLLSVFDSAHVWNRALLGAALGILAAAGCAGIVSSVPQFARLRALAEHAVEGIEPRWHTMLIVALAAGLSEEFFFRGALEPVAGPWLGAAAFVVLHGAVRLRNRGVIAFAVFLFAASLGFSALNARNGLEAAMAAHVAYDLTMFAWLSRPRPGAR